MLYVEIPYGITAAEITATPDVVGIPYFNRNHYVALPSTDALLYKTIDDLSLLKYFPVNLINEAVYTPAFRSISIFTDERNDNYEYISKDGTTLYYLGVDKLYLDIDTQSILESQVKTRRLVKWLNGIGIYHYRLYFSGSKGFHIVLNLEDVFGEHKYVNSDILKELVNIYISSLSGVKLDPSIYANRSIIRLPNTVNIKTKMFKIEITEQELMRDIGEIELLALGRRDIVYVPPTRQSDYSVLKNMIVLATDLVQHKADNREHFVNDIDGDPINEIAFIEEFIDGRELKPGTRHDVSLTLASYFRARGLDISEAERLLVDFMQGAKGSSTPIAQRVRESRNDIKTCYNKHIRFSKIRASEILT